MVDSYTNGGFVNFNNSLIQNYNVTVTGARTYMYGGLFYNTKDSKLLLNNYNITATTTRLTETLIKAIGVSIYNDGILNMTSGSLSNNKIVSVGTNTTIVGATIYNNGNTSLLNTTFNGLDANLEITNATIHGGIVYNNITGNLSLINNTFNNTVIGSERISSHNSYTYGGVIYNRNLLLADDELKIENNTFSNNKAYYGGVIYHDNASNITVNNNTFISNEAFSYGGVFVTNGYNMTIINSNFTSNKAGSYGGVVYSTTLTNLTILESNFTSNTASSYGGVIYTTASIGGTVNITNSNFTSNIASSGGVLYYTGGNSTFNITNSNFTSNTGSSNGGVIYFTGGNSTFNITDSDFTSNRATSGSGGVLYYDGTNATITVNNASFTGSYAYGMGGAIYVNGGSNSTLNITNVNFTRNYISKSASGTTYSYVYGGAIYFNSNYSNVTIKDTNFTNNYLSLSGSSTSGYSSYSYGGAIYYTGSYNNFNITNINFINNTVRTSGYSYGSYGGAIYHTGSYNNFTITNNSFTNNRVNNSYGYGGAISYSGSYNNITEIGNNYTSNYASYYGGAIYYSGSYSNITELDSNYTSNYADVGGASYFTGSYSNITEIGNNYTSNHANSGGAIYLSYSRRYTNNYFFNINNSNFINNYATYYGGALYFYSNYGYDNTYTLNITNTTFTNNRLTGTSYSTKYGGAIYSYYGTVTIKNSTFTNNTIPTAYYDLRGGAIYKENGILNINNTSFTNNSIIRTDSYYSYGSVGGAIYTSAKSNITNNNFTNNSVRNIYDSWGGAIYNSNSLTNITNSIFMNNSATKTSSYTYTVGGGAVYSNYGFINNVTFINNHVSNSYYSAYGGALYTYNTVTVNNTSFINNTARTTGSNSNSSGGAVYVGSGTLNTYNISFINNSAISTGSNSNSSGGAISINMAINTIYLNLNDTTFVNNSAISNGTNSKSMGGAVYAGVYYTGIIGSSSYSYNYNIRIGNSTFTNNCALSNGTSSTASAGALYSGVTIDRTNYPETSSRTDTVNYYVTVTNTTFNNNMASATGNNTTSLGGAINGLASYTGFLDGTYNSRYYNSNITILNSSFANNTAGVNGTNGVSRGGTIYGGADFTGSTATESDTHATNKRDYRYNLTLSNSNIAGSTSMASGVNATSIGGAIYDASYCDVENSTTRYLYYNIGINSTNITDSTLSVNDSNVSTYAGALFVNGNVTLNSSIINNNSATYGGAVYIDGNLTVNNSTFIYNNATYGGAIYNNATFSLTSNTNLFDENTAEYGGVIYNIGNLTLANTHFTEANATKYGGILYNTGIATVINSTLNSSTALRGGAIYNDNILYINGTNVTLNNATSGSAIYNDGNATIDDNTLISNNTAAEYGGAIYNNGNVTVTNSALNSNKAQNGGLVYTTSTSNTTFTSNHVENNTATGQNSFIVYNEGVFTATNNVFENNSNTKREDVLFLHDADGINANTYASGNTYNNNSLHTNTTIIVPSETETGIIFNVTVDLYPVYNSTVKNGNISLGLNNAIYGNYTVANGYTTVEIPFTTLKDRNDIEANYTAYDLSYQASDDDYVLTKVPTHIVIDHVDVIEVNTETIVNITLLDVLDRHIEGDNLTILINGNEATKIVNVTDANGRIQVLLDNSTLVVGKNNISVVYDGSRLYQNSTNSSIINVDKIHQYITATVVNPYVANTTIQVNVTDVKTGAALNDTPVSVTLANGTVVRGITDKNGLVNITVPTVINGTITVGLYANTTYTHKEANNTMDINVLKRPTTLSNIELVNATTKNVTAVVTLMDLTNADKVYNGTVTVYETINGTRELIGSNNITGGTANISVLIPLTPGILHDFEVVYEGDDWYLPSDDIRSTYVEKLYSIISSENIEDKVFNQVLISANITDSRENIIINGTVTVEVGSETFTTEIKNGKIEFNYTFDSVGLHKVVLSYPGDGEYQSTIGIVNVTIVKRNTTTQPTVNNGVIDITVLDYNQQLVRSNGTVVVREGDNIIGTGLLVNGKTNITPTTVLTGSHSLTVEYRGDDNYNPSNSTITWSSDKLNTIISLTNYTTTVNKTVEITGTVTGSDGKVITGKVNLTINTTKIENVDVKDGKFTYSYTPQTSGTLQVNVEYAGNETYNSASNRTNIVVNTIDTRIAINNTALISAGESTQINVTLTDSEGNVLSGKTIKLTIDGVSHNIVTNSSGVANYTYKPTDGGVKSIIAQYDGDNVYTASTNTSSITSNRIDTILTITNDDVVNVNQTTTIRVKLTENDGTTPVAGKSINITVGNQTQLITTLADGSATYSYTPQTSGDKHITARFDGDDIYVASTNSSTITAERINTTVTVSSIDTMNVGESTVINVTLKDVNGNPLSNKSVDIIIDGQPVRIDTNSNGQANFTYNPINDGTKQIVVRFDGDDVYVESTNNTNLRVNKIETNITVTAISDMKVNQTTVINVTLKDANGNLLANKEVNLVIDGNVTRLTTDSNGKANYTYNPQTNGRKNIIAEYVGDMVYVTSSDTHYLTVDKINTTLEIPYIEDAKIGYPTEINVTLTDEYGNKLSNKTIILTVGDISRKLTTDANGTIRHNYTTDKESFVNIIAVFDETDIYHYDVEVNSYYINKINTNITNITVTSGSVGNSSINMTLVDEFGKTVPNAEIIIKYDNGTVILSNYTDSNGVLNTPIDLTGGDYNLVIEYNGNQTYSETETTVDIGVSKLPSELVITKGGNRVGNTTLYFKLTDKTSGNPIVYSNVTLYNTTTRQIIGTYTTDSNGMIELPIFLLQGNHTFTAIYNGSAIYDNTTTTLSYEVLKVPTRTTREIVHRFIDGFAINATVLPDTDQYGNLTIRNGTVNVYIQGNSTPVATGELVDGSVMLYPKIDNPGTYNLTISYMGNDYYQESGLTMNYTLDKAPTAIIPQRQGDYVGNTTVTAILKDNENNKLLSNATVKVEVDGINVANVTTDENGQIELKLNLTAGDHSVNFVYGGNDTYRGANNTISYPVIKIPVLFNQTKAINTSLENSTILVEVLDDRTKTPVLNGTVVIYDTDNAEPVKIGEGTITPSDNGTIEIKTNIQLEGNHNLVIVYEGNDYYQARNTTLIFETDKTSTHLLNEKIGHYVGNTSLDITLQDVNNQIIPNAIVKVINATSGNIIATGHTDENGKTILDVNLPAGSHPLQIVYDGNETYTATSVNLTYVVDKIPTKTTRNVTYRFVEDFTINVTVTTDASDLSSLPVQNGTVNIYLNGTDELVGTGQVNNGSVLIKTTYQELGKQTFTIQYMGNDYYLNSSTVLEDVDIVTIPTALTPIKNGTYVGNTSLTVNIKEHTLTDLDDVLPNSIINVYENGTLIATGVTDEYGNVTFKLNLTAGNHNLKISYDGNTTHRSIEQDLPYDVLKRPTSIVGLDTLNSTVGNVTLKVTVNDTAFTTHTPVQNGTVRISFYNGTQIGEATVVNGVAIVKTNITESGKYSLVVNYLENDYYQATRITQPDMSFTDRTKTITVTVVNNTVGNTTIEVNLTDGETNEPLPNTNITVILPDGTTVNATTGDDGLVNVTIPTNTSGEITVNITSPGNETYAQADTNKTIDVTKRPTTTKATIINTMAQNNTINVRVIDQYSQTPVIKGEVELYYNGVKIGNGTLTRGEATILTTLDTKGTYELDAVYLENDYYYSSNDDITVDIAGRPQNITITVVNNTIGNTTVEVNVTDNITGEPLPNTPVNITLPNGTIINGTTNDEGLVNITIPTYNNQTIPINVTVPDTPVYDNATINSSVTPEKRPSETSYEIVNDKVGETTLNITVTDKTTGEVVPNGTVVIKDGTGKQIGNGTVVDGKTTIILDTLPARDNPIVIEYGGNEVYNPSENDTVIPVVKKDVVINTTVVNETIGNTTIEVNVTDINGTPIPDMPINITLPNGTVVNGTTDENGTVNITIPTENNETIPINITTPETDEYNNGTNTTDITPEKRPSVTSPEVINNTVGETKLDVTVTDATTGDLVPNGTVVIKDSEGNPVGNGTVNNGKVIIDVNLPAGNHTVTVEYGGNEVYNPSANTTKIEIIKKDVVINTTVVNDTIGNTTIEVNVTDGNGTPIPDMPINITLPNGTVVNGTTNENGTVNITIPTVNNETIPIDITTPETDEYNNGTNTTEVTPEKRPSQTSYEVVNDKVGETTLDITVTDKATGDLVPNGTVVIKDETGKQIGTGEVTDGKTTIILDTLPAGDNPIVIEYQGNEVYNPSENDTTIPVVKKDVVITPTVVNETIGNTTIEVNVTDGNGTPIPDMPVNITLPNGTVVNGTTNENGTVNITIPTNDTKPIDVNITTPETDEYNNGTNTTDITPEKRPSMVSPEVIDNIVGEAKLDITVADAINGTIIPYATVIVKNSNGTPIGVGITDANGKVIINVDLPAGNHTVTVEFIGNDLYYSSVNNTRIEILKKDVVINTTVVNDTIGNTTIEVNVTDGNGTPIPDMPINITLPNGTVINGTTNENGTVNITIPTNGTDPIDVNITTPETDEYNNGTNTTDITPEKRDSTITPEVIDNTVGETKLDVTVTDATTGDLVPNGTVTVKDSEGNPIGNGTVVDGKVIIDVDLPAGNHTVTVEYGGNEVYNPSVNTTQIEIIKKDVVINTTIINETVGNTTIEVNVTDGNGTPIPDMPINITLPNGTVVNGTTNENGTVNITIPTVNNETIPIDITTPETDEYNNGTNTTEVTPEKIGVRVTLPNYEMYVLDYSNITVNVTDEYGNPVNGGYIIFKVNGKTLQANGKFSVTGRNPMKINVYNGKATIVFNATSFYKKGGINTMLVKYSGSSKYNQNASSIQKLTIKKRLGYVEVTTDKTEYKLYETVNIKATYYDITHGNKTAIYSDNTTYAVYKINGITSNYNNTNERYAITNSTATVGTDSQSKLNYIQYNYTAPGPNTVNSTVTIKTHNEYYNALTNTTTFKIVPSPMTINFTSVTFNKTSNRITIEADLKDYMNNTVSGINKYCVKINGITYYGNLTGGHIFTVENGKIYLSIYSTTSNVRSIELVTGQRYAYSEARNTTTNINVVN